jgi:hypothetical protein
VEGRLYTALPREAAPKKQRRRKDDADSLRAQSSLGSKYNTECRAAVEPYKDRRHSCRCPTTRNGHFCALRSRKEITRCALLRQSQECRRSLFNRGVRAEIFQKMRATKCVRFCSFHITRKSTARQERTEILPWIHTICFAGESRLCKRNIHFFRKIC